MEQGLNTYFYRVAEHLFAVESKDNAIFALLSNYEPFLSTSHDTAIFTLRIEQDGLLCNEQRSRYQHIFTDNSEEDMPRIEVYRGDRAPQNATSVFGNPAEAMRREGDEARDADGWLMRVSQIAHSPICCELVSNRAFTQGTLHIAPDCNDLRFCIDNALMLMFAFRTAPLLTLEMHAAVVVKETGGEDLGYLFLGHSGTGKSTHARQWLQAFPDAWLLNDDNPILRIMDNGDVHVYGSPWSGKTPCYKNAHVRVGGIIKLSQAPHNQLHPLTLPQAYAYMLSSASGLKMEQQMADQMFNTIKHIITHVKCHHLECLPNTDAAQVCFQGVRCKV